MIQIYEGMDYKYGYPKSAIDESEKTLEETIYKSILDGSEKDGSFHNSIQLY